MYKNIYINFNYIYLLEEIYYIIGNTHIMDRLNIPMRNLAVLITVFILSSLLIKKQFKLYRHQLFPSLIVIATSLTLIIFNVLDITRFKKIFNINKIFNRYPIYQSFSYFSFKRCIWNYDFYNN